MKKFLYILFLCTIPALALGWWYLVSEGVIWLWTELILTRPTMSEKEAIIHFIAVTAVSVTAIPQFYWLPVHIYKLTKYQIDEEVKHDLRHYRQTKWKESQVSI